MTRLTQDQIDRRIAFLQMQLCGKVHPMTILSINNTIERLIMMEPAPSKEVEPCDI